MGFVPFTNYKNENSKREEYQSNRNIWGIIYAEIN